jgi:hypothetical protein
MEKMKELQGAKLTPVQQEKDSVYRGGVHDNQGQIVEGAKHVRWGGRIVHNGANMADFEAGSQNLPPGIYGGIFFNHFGHFLTESLGRLWPVNDDGLKDLPIYVHSMWGSLDLAGDDSYHAICMRTLGVDPSRIKIIGENSIIERLLVPRQRFWYGASGTLDPEFMAFLAKGQQRIEARLGDGELPKKLYVSRTNWSPSRGIAVGEPEFEAFLCENGYTAMCPETMSYRRQLEHYVAADSIIFAEGSASHGCILLPRLRAKVAIVMRREYGARGAVKGKVFGFVNDVLVIQEVSKRLSFNMPDWSGVSYINYENVSRTLVAAGFLGSSFAKWPTVQPHAEKIAVSRFCKDAADYDEFRSFLIKVGHT